MTVNKNAERAARLTPLMIEKLGDENWQVEHCVNAQSTAHAWPAKSHWLMSSVKQLRKFIV